MKVIETYFWMCLVGALVCGLFTPALGLSLRPWVIPLIMMITFFTLFRVDVQAIVQHLQRPWPLTYLLAGQLVIIPALLYVVFQVIDPVLGVSCLLLAAMPPALAAVALTDIVQGDTALSLTLTVLAHCVAPLSVTVLLYTLAGTVVAVGWWSLVQHLVLIIGVPMGCSWVARRLASTFVAQAQPLVNPINVILLALTIYIVVAAQSATIHRDALILIPKLLGLYGLFGALYVMGYAWAFRFKEEERLSVCVTNTYMNNGLAIALAYSFFEAEISVLVVLSELPWVTTLGGFRYLQRLGSHWRGRDP